MDEKDKDLEAGGSATPTQAVEEEGAAFRDRSATRSASREGDYDKITIPNSQSQRKSQDVEETLRHGCDTDDTASDHGEPDVEHEEAEEAVPGRDLDRQLSRVCKSGSVSPRGLCR